MVLLYLCCILCFASGGLVITVDSGLSVDPSRLSIHLPGTVHFTKATLPPTRTALYSYILNTPELISLIETAKENEDASVATDVWVEVSKYRGQLTASEVERFLADRDTLPWPTVTSSLPR